MSLFKKRLFIQSGRPNVPIAVPVVGDRRHSGEPQKSGTFRDLSKISPPINSFPELERALDSGAVDGIIIDDTFVPKDDHWIAVEIPQNSSGWKAYLDEVVGRPQHKTLHTWVLLPLARAAERHSDRRTVSSVANVAALRQRPSISRYSIIDKTYRVSDRGQAKLLLASILYVIYTDTAKAIT
jgi:hypothetical protein